MKFMHNYISTKSNPPTLSDIIKAAQTKVAMATAPVTKTAATVAEVTTAKGNIGNFGDKKAKPFGAKGKDDKDEVVEVELEEKESCNTGGKGKKKAKASVVATKQACDEAESSGQLEEKANPQNDPQSDPKLKGNKAGKGGGESDEAESSGQLEEKANPQNDPEVKKDAVSIKKWILLANLTSEQKGFVREELEKFWPKKFVDALLADR